MICDCAEHPDAPTRCNPTRGNFNCAGDYRMPPLPEGMTCALAAEERKKQAAGAMYDALKALFALHEPEGRFQPHHFKPILRQVAAALKLAEEGGQATIERCPSCDSPAPHLHPAIQCEGEVETCPHDFHLTPTPQNTKEYIDLVLAKQRTKRAAP